MTIRPTDHDYNGISLTKPPAPSTASGLATARSIVQRRAAEAKGVEARDLARRILADLNVAITAAKEMSE